LQGGRTNKERIKDETLAMSATKAGVKLDVARWQKHQKVPVSTD